MFKNRTHTLVINKKGTILMTDWGLLMPEDGMPPLNFFNLLDSKSSLELKKKLHCKEKDFTYELESWFKYTFIPFHLI